MAAKNKTGKIVSFNNGSQGGKSGKRGGMMIGSLFILIVVVIAFVVAPILSGGGYKGTPVFGSYGNIRIKFIQDNFFAREVNKANDMYAPYFNSEDMDEAQMDWMRRSVWRYAFDRSISHYATIYFMEKSGFFVTEKRIDKSIVQAYTVDGVFDSEAYAAESATQKQQLRKDIREQLTVQTFSNDILYSQFTNEKQSEFLKNMGETQRNFSYVTFSFQDFPSDQVKAYADENSKQFQKIKVSRVTVDEQKEAKDILAKHEANEYSFEDLARNFSQDAYAENGGDMGWLYYNNLSDQLNEADIDQLFASTKETVAGPYETEHGWVVFLVQESAEDIDLTEERGIEQVRFYMESEEIGVIEDYLEEKATEFATLAREKGFNGASLELNKSTSVTGFFPVNYGNLSFIKGSLANSNDILTMAGANSSQEFYRTAFALNEGSPVSDPVVLDKSVAVLNFEGEKELTEKAQDYEIRNFTVQSKQSYFDVMTKESDQLVDQFDETYDEIFN